jgi:GNAT superfamily N-acetyltransferase
MTLTIRQLGPADAGTFEHALAIYREAIAPSEQRPEDELRMLLGRRDYVVLTAEQGGEVVGFAISYVPLAEDFWLFEYVATIPAKRGQGAGAALVRQATRLAGEGRVGLVEADADTGRDPIAGKRLRFYERIGCRKLEGLDYLLPLRTHGLPPPMLLLALAPPTLASLPLEAVERWLRLIYIGVYRQSEGDLRIGEMIGGLPSNVCLTSSTQPGSAVV